MSGKRCFEARLKAQMSDFGKLFQAADKYAGGTVRWAEIQPGYFGFCFEDQDAFLKFCFHVEDETEFELLAATELPIADPMAVAKRAEIAKQSKPPSEKLRTCRSLVHDNAFDACLAVRMVLPLLKGTLEHMKTEPLRASGTFLRRALVRYLALALCRLLDKPNDAGRTGATASLASLLEMARTEAVLSLEQVEGFESEFEKLKTDATQGEYDIVKALYDLRTIQVAHSLIPWNEPEDTLWAHHLVEFSDALFELVARVETSLTHASGEDLPDLRSNAANFGANAEQFWKSVSSMK